MDNDTKECAYNLTKMQESVKSFLIRDLLGIGSGGNCGSDVKSLQNSSENGNFENNFFVKCYTVKL